MLFIYALDEILTNNLEYNFLSILSAIAISSGILVIISKNPIVSVLFLIALFVTVASYLMMLGINFIGLSYLLVYVGAVSILFLFILMLINVRISELVVNSSNSIPLAIMISLFFGLVSRRILFQKFEDKPTVGSRKESDTYSIDSDLTGYDYNSAFSDVYNNGIYFVSSYMWDGKLSETFHITSIGNIIYTNFPMWLILTSIILLLSMIGSILITIKN